MQTVQEEEQESREMNQSEQKGT